MYAKPHSKYLEIRVGPAERVKGAKASRNSTVQWEVGQAVQRSYRSETRGSVFCEHADGFCVVSFVVLESND